MEITAKKGFLSLACFSKYLFTSFVIAKGEYSSQYFNSGLS
jgi:hypothetical protein